MIQIDHLWMMYSQQHFKTNCESENHLDT